MVSPIKAPYLLVGNYYCFMGRALLLKCKVKSRISKKYLTNYRFSRRLIYGVIILPHPNVFYYWIDSFNFTRDGIFENYCNGMIRRVI